MKENSSQNSSQGNSSYSSPQKVPVTPFPLGVCREKVRQNPMSFQNEVQRKYLNPNFLQQLDEHANEVDRAFESAISKLRK